MSREVRIGFVAEGIKSDQIFIGPDPQIADGMLEALGMHCAWHERPRVAWRRGRVREHVGHTGAIDRLRNAAEAS